MLGRCDSMAELVAYATNGVIVKKFKWEEFVRMERKRDHYVIWYQVCYFTCSI